MKLIQRNGDIVIELVVISQYSFMENSKFLSSFLPLRATHIEPQKNQLL